MLIISGKYGELGNRLFTFANVLAFALEHNLTVINPAFEEYSCWFRSTVGNSFCQYPPAGSVLGTNHRYRHILFKTANFLMRVNSRIDIYPSIRLGWQEKFNFSSDDPWSIGIVEQIKSTDICFLDGFYFLDHRNFIKYSRLIRDFFRPIEIVEKNVNSYISQARKNVDILIGVHIRQGDYRNHSSGLMYYSVEEYVSVLRKIIRLFKDKTVKLIICSNEKQDPRNFREFIFQLGPGHFMEDLHTLSNCDYIVGAPSTFTQWASFYGQVPKYTINYKNEHFYGVKGKNAALEAFEVHYAGFGKHCLIHC
jgi:hypothetical protein